MAPKKSIPVDEYRRLAAQGNSISETAAILGVKPQTVFVVGKRHNIEFPKGYIKKEKRGATVAIQSQD